jgi:hypothetical protein
MTAFHSKGLVNVRAMRVAHALIDRPQRFADLQDKVINHQQALARVSHKLEADQMICRVYNGYALTARGKSWSMRRRHFLSGSMRTGSRSKPIASWFWRRVISTAASSTRRRKG